MKKIILIILMSFISVLGYSQLNEGFEGAPNTPNAAGVWALPQSGAIGTWLVRDNRTNGAPNFRINNQDNFPAHTGTGAAFIDRENAGINVTAEEWLITPRLTLTANSQFRFFTRQTFLGQTQPNTTRYKVLASSSADQGDLASYTTVLADYTEAELSSETPDFLDYEEKIIDLPFAGARYIAFVKVYTQPTATISGDRWLIDDVRVVPKCVDPVMPFVIKNLTSTGVTITWPAPTSTTFQLQYGISGFELGTGTIVAPFTSTTTPREYTIERPLLTPGTCYQVYVRSVCSDSNSNWVGPFNFCTPPFGSTCAEPKVVPLLPYSDASNTLIYGNNIPGNTPGNTGCGTTGSYLASNDVVYTYTPTETGILNITMNPLGATNTGVFVYNSCANIGVTCTNGIANANANIRVLGAVNVQAGVPIYIVISSTTATANFQYTLTIQKVTCPNPSVGSATSTGMTSANLIWTNGATSTATSWQIDIQNAGAGVPTGEGDVTVTGGVPAYTAQGLEPGTPYQFWVRADCGNGLYSIWSGPYFFNTAICEIANQCNYTFVLTDTSGGWNGATMQVRQNNIVVATLGTGFTTGTGPINTVVPLCTNVPFDLFWNNAGTQPGQVRIAIKNNFNQTVFAMTTSSADLAGTSLYTQLVDCINPLCQKPTGLAVPAATIFPHTATINWVSSGVPTIGWGIAVVPSGQAPPILPQYTVLSPATPPFTIPDGDLNADTPYDVYVQSICSVNGPSTWTGPVSFTTKPTCAKPTGVVANAITNVSFHVQWVAAAGTSAWQVLVLPSPSTLPLPTTGWLSTATNSIDINAANYPGITAGTKYDVYVRSVCLDGADIGMPQTPIIVETKVCAAVNQCNYTFTLRDTGSDGWEGGRIQVRQNGVIVATLGTPFTGAGPLNVVVPLCNGIPFDLFWSIGGTTPSEIRISVTNSFNQVIYNMNVASAGLVGTVIYSDSKADCIFPKCLPPTNLSADPDIFSAELDWVPAGNNTGWDVYLALSPATPPTATDEGNYQNITAHPFTIPQSTPLLPNTAYQYWVRADCAVGSPGDWVGPFLFTTLPTCPKPTGLNYVSTDSNSANLVWSQTTGPATSWTVIVQPTGGTPGPSSPQATTTTLPTLAAPFNTLAGFGELVPGFYEFYVRANCTTDDLSAWAGPFNFFIATALPVCASVEVQELESAVNGVIDFCPGENCIDLSASFTNSGATTTYTVLPVNFAPPFPFTGGTQLPLTSDDIWSAPAVLPFSFCFFGANYNSVQVGTNGVLTFTPQVSPGTCAWNTTPGQVIPNTEFPIRNAIYGVYQDIDPTVSTAPLAHSINYQVIGEAPCRSFVVNYYQVAPFDTFDNDCPVSEIGTQTSQIVLYETSNIIEVYVQDRKACTGWNEGLGVIGIQNNAGTQAHFPPDRNLGVWDAHNEAWRFTPAGNSNVAFSWLKNGDLLTNDTSVNVCVTETTTMTAKAVYTGCGGQQTTKTKTVLLRVNPIDVPDVADVVRCDSYTLPALTLGAYYSEPGGVNPITNNVITSTQQVYVYAQTQTTPPCHDEESFLVTIQDLVAPEPQDVSECFSYTLPQLNPPFQYYSAPGGQQPLTGPITTSQRVYIYGNSDLCTAESSFNVTIGEIQAFEQADLAGCTTVTLPQLPAGQTYYTLTGGPNGSGIPITAPTITSSQTIYIYAQNGSCNDESSFNVTISDNIVPTFDPIPTVCVGDTAQALPLTSLNSITGTWLPSVIDTSTAGTREYFFTPNGVLECAVPTSIFVTVAPIIVPTFNQVPDLCLNATPPVLPTVSTNGITGSWNTTIITTAVGTFPFTFTPDPGQGCTVPTTINVTVSTQILPLFTQIANVCQNTTAPILPTTSLNGVVGTWDAAINTATPNATLYTFIPALTEACAIPTTMTVTVDPEIIPVFTQITAICKGAVAPTLPLVSNNLVVGTWSPNTINTAVAGTVRYDFTAAPGQVCVLPVSMNITITEPTQPNFSSQITLCAGDTAPLLATTSPTGVVGSWVPNVIDNTTSGTYDFTPAAGQCAVGQRITVTVNPVTIPTFAQIAPICSGATAPVLPTTSLNGITGTWAPAIVNVNNSACYTFTPNPGQCATAPPPMCITVNPTRTPVFNQIPPVCLGSQAPPLPTTSTNNISGTWNPSVIDNSTVGIRRYTFTPNQSELCAVQQTMDIEIGEVPVFDIKGGCQSDNTYKLYTDPDFGTTGVNYTWRRNGDVIADAGNTNTITITATGTYSVEVSANGCPATEIETVNSVACIIQRGISPKGVGYDDGKNDFFDLQGMNVKKLEIFNRYGTKVYEKDSYSNEWYGQSDKGDELPDGTYFYSIEYSTARKSETGWIYINRRH